MSNSRFDAEAFYSALDAHRKSKDITWKKVASETGVAASTLTRMGQGKRPDVDGLAALASWSGLDANDFFRSADEAPKQAEPMAQISALLRADRNLSGEGAIALESMLMAAYETMRRDRAQKT